MIIKNVAGTHRAVEGENLSVPRYLIKKMAKNFKINVHQEIDSLHIRLMGDFDGSSAFELLNAIGEKSNSYKSILVDTHRLKEVYPFGREVFYNNFLRMKNRPKRCRFVGPNALHLAPI